jgi:UDP-galactopyranose mutase
MFILVGAELRQEYDYIVVGAGSAGVVLARRLADAGKLVKFLPCSWQITVNKLTVSQM